MPTPKTPFGNGPSNLAKPVPGAKSPDEASKIQAEMEKAVNASLSKWDSIKQRPGIDTSGMMVQSPDGEMVPMQAEDMEADPSFAEANFTPGGIKRQMETAGQRFKYSFAQTPRETVNMLKQTGKYADVRLSPAGEVEVKPIGKSKYINFDPQTIELMSDVIDGARGVFEGVAENAGRIFGFAGGAAGTAPAGGIGALPAAAAGGAAASIAAREGADQFAEKVLGVERDPRRSRVMENTVAGTFGALFSGVGNQLAKKQAEMQLRKQAFAQTEQTVRSQVDNAIQAVEAVRSSGIRLGKDGEFFLDPAQVGGKGVPEFMETAKKLSSDKATAQPFRQFRERQQQILSEAFDSLTQMIGNGTGKVIGKGKDFVLGVKDMRDFEGAIIGRFRNEAAAKAGGKKMPVLSSGERLDQAMKEVAPKDAAGNLIPGKPGDLLTQKHVEESIPQLQGSYAAYYANTLNRLRKLVKDNEGALPMSVLEKEYKMLTKKIDSLMGSTNGRDLGQHLIVLKDGLRDDWIGAIGQNLGPGSAEAYKQALAKYSSVMKASQDLKNILKSENISAEALADHIFTPGVNNVKRMKAVRTLYNETEPEAWRDLAGIYMNKLRNQYTVKEGVGPNAVNVVDWSALRKHINGLPGEMREELYYGTGLNNTAVNALLDLGTAVQKADFDFVPTTRQKSMMKRAFYAMFSFATNRYDQAEELFNSMGRNKSLSIWLKEGGANELLKEFPEGKTKSRAARFFENFDPNHTIHADKMKQAASMVRASTVRTGARRNAGAVVPDPIESLIMQRDSDQTMSTETP